VLTQGHDKSADCWAYGVLIFELLCGYTPFEGRNQQRTFEKIVHSQKYLSFPNGFDPHAKSVIRRLLHPNPVLRLGALQNGFDDVKSQAFFITRSINFDQLLKYELPMPYIPLHEAQCDDAVVSFDIQEELHAVVENDYKEFFEDLTIANTD
jgi:serine/threonine protein kinase